MFIEEPCQAQNHDMMAEIARSTYLPIATGERVFTKWGFREVLEKHAAAILQPDLCHAGGITEVRLIAGMAEAYYAAIAPHNPLGPISLAAGVQMAASIPNFLCQEQVALGEGYIKPAVHGRPRVIWTCPRRPAWASSSTRTPWPARSATTGAIPSYTTPTTAAWSIGSHGRERLGNDFPTSHFTPCRINALETELGKIAQLTGAGTEDFLRRGRLRVASSHPQRPSREGRPSRLSPRQRSRTPTRLPVNNAI